MKRYAILIILALISVIPVLAQDAPDLITLNDATPAIDAVITLPQDTTGTIALDFSGAEVKLTDAGGSTVFSAADSRLHGLELNIAPNSGSHTLTVERLPDVLEAYVRVNSLPELTQNGTTELISDLALNFNQEVSLPLDSGHPGNTVSVTIPDEEVGVITATFPGANATTQLVDAGGVVLIESVGGHIDGMNLVLDAGEYQLTLLGSNLSQSVVAGVRVLSVADAGFAVLQAPETTLVSAATANCSAVVAVSSVNLRTGPGTGYSVSGYGYRNQTFAVGGHNPEDNWLLVATDAGSAWAARSNLQTQGDCADLTVFNIPLREAQVSPLVITTTTTSPTVGGDDDDHDEREEHEEHEEGDDD